MTEQIHVRARKFLQEFFNDEELTTLCFDYFPQVHNDFTQEMTKNQKIVKFVSFCQRWDRFDELLAVLEQERPEQYHTHFAQKSLQFEPQSKQIIIGSGLVLLIILAVIFWPEQTEDPTARPTEVAEVSVTETEFLEVETTPQFIASTTPSYDAVRTALASTVKQTEEPSIENISQASATPTFDAIATALALTIKQTEESEMNTSQVSETPINPPENAQPGEPWIRPADGMQMVFVPGGTFLMGSSSSVDNIAQGNEFPQHNVMLSSFWIDKTEVTNEQFVMFLNDLRNQEFNSTAWLGIDTSNVLIEYNGTSYSPKAGFGNHPVVNVSWYEARAYCEWVGGSLPTEAQWEYVARGMDGRIYPWGDQFDSSRVNSLGLADGYEMTAPSGSYSPKGDSWVGAADMVGNVSEWVADWYESNYENGLTNNPIGPGFGDYKVLRGGGWNGERRHLRIANREIARPESRSNNIGFRCAFPSD